MNPQPDTLPKAADTRLPRGPAPAPGALQLTPIDLPVDPPVTPDPALSHPPNQPTRPNAAPGRPALPDWRLTALFAGLGAALAGIWLTLIAPFAAPLGPTLSPISPAYAAPQPDEPAQQPPLASATPAPPPSRRAAPPPTSAPPQPTPPRAATPVLADPPVRLHPTRADAHHAAPLLAAHDAYTAGDLPQADALYRRALAVDPHSADAHNGLGAIALVRQRPADAEAHFRRALQARPDDPTALAGLARLPSGNPAPPDSRLRDTLATLGDAPESLAPRLALADRLARRQRWAEAQQAYFDAHRLAPASADIVYNLAVSLDHLGQQRQAAIHYRKALTLAARQPDAAARFPRARCAERLAALQPTAPTP